MHFSPLKKNTKDKKVACVILCADEYGLYEKIGDCAINSFSKWHPEVDIHVINSKNIKDFECYKYFESTFKNHLGIFRFACAAEIMGKNKYDKIIMMGGDTITCARLDEFMDNDHDIIGSLDFNYQPQIHVSKKYFKQEPLPISIFEDETREYVVFFSPLVRPIKKGKIREVEDIYKRAGWIENVCFIEQKNNPKYDLMVMYTSTNADQPRFPPYELSPHPMSVGEGYFKNQDFEIEDTFLLTQNMHANPDVVCFNSLLAIKDVVRHSLIHLESVMDNKNPNHSEWLINYADQGGLNVTMCMGSILENNRLGWTSGYNFNRHSVYFPEFPIASKSTPLYNTRSKKTLFEEVQCLSESLGWGWDLGQFKPHPPKLSNKENGESIKEWYVKDNKLYTKEHKQIKAWHHMAQLGSLTKQHKKMTDLCKIEGDFGDLNIKYKKFCEQVNLLRTMFNEETREFFESHCDCGNFFKEEFSL
jgi:hypothetical protein